MTVDNEISEFLKRYNRATHIGDVDTLKTCFDENCVVDGYCADVRWRVTLAEYFALIEEYPSNEAQGLEDSTEVLSVDQTGRSAIVKVRETSTPMQYTDYLSLIRLESGWVVTHKAYYSKQPPPV